MDIKLKEITIRELSKGYVDNADEGVLGYDGKLDIRPPYQREFIYKDKQRDAVIDTVTKEFPLNVMYWSVNNDEKYEIIDGQQRTISICQYVDGVFSHHEKYFDNLQDDEQKKILDYKLMIYQCKGENSEKLEWFKTINIAGEKLTDQELRNAVYHGTWVTNAKEYFSKTNCVAYNLASDYMDGAPIRQKYLETAIKWISNSDKDEAIREYMGKHQHEQNANELRQYFNSVIIWVETTFITKRPNIMKQVDWGYLYNEYKDKKVNTVKIEKEIEKLILDDDVTKKPGIYKYILTRDEKHLSIRSFTPSEKQKAYEAQNGVCNSCKESFEFSEMQGDHIKPWSKDGKTIQSNCQMLCGPCNKNYGNK